MGFTNAVNLENEGVPYVSTAGVWSGIDPSTTTFVLTSNGTGVAPSFQAATSGTVTSVSVVSANGFAGTVANPTTTPAITLTTTITGVLSGNGTAISGSTVTQHGVVVGGASNAVTSTSVGASGTVLIGNTGADPTFSAYPQISGLGIGASPGSTAGLTFDGSNFMNAYATGTWTPTLNFGGATTGITYATQNGYYTKIGNMVYVSCEFSLTSIGSATGVASVSGLPFTVKNQTQYNPVCAILYGAGMAPTAGNTLAAFQFLGNTTTGQFNQYTIATGNNAQLTNANFPSTAYIAFDGWYQA